MTNKELFEMFVYDYDLNNPQNKEDLDKYQEVIEKLKKSMEILDLIKKWFVEKVEDYSFSKNPHFWINADYIYDNEPIFKVIKEWLENDKNM